MALRYFNVFGPRQDPLSQYAAVIPKFIIALLDGSPPVIHGDGEQSRDFTYIDNVVDANLLAATASGVGGQVFNIACGENITLNALFDELRTLAGSEIDAVHEEPRAGDVRDSLADVSAAREAPGPEPRAEASPGWDMHSRGVRGARRLGRPLPLQHWPPGALLAFAAAMFFAANEKPPAAPVLRDLTPKRWRGIRWPRTPPTPPGPFC